MAVSIQKTLHELRNKRDLRAEILSLAAELASNESKGRMIVSAPIIAEVTVQQEWDRLLPAIAPEIRARMSLLVEKRTEIANEKLPGYRVESGLALLERPNYRFEVLRLCVGANLEDDGPQSVKNLIDKVGASQTPIRNAIAELKRAGVVHSWRGGVDVLAEDLSTEKLAKIGALPQTLHFRFERGAQIKPPAVLLKRVMPLLGSSSPDSWAELALSGTAVALADVPTLDLIGVPRLDLVAHMPRAAKVFDTRLLRQLDGGLELEPNVLTPSPVVVTIVQADTAFIRDAGLDKARCAYPMDVFLSLLDLGLRDQAIEYAKAVRT
jgi:hypothetical protein